MSPAITPDRTPTRKSRARRFNSSVFIFYKIHFRYYIINSEEIMEFDIFYYENDISTIKNKKNPRIILSNPSVLRVLSDIINQTPNSIDINQYSNNEITNSLLMIDAIKLCNNKLSLNIPIFIERDLPILKKYISLASKKNLPFNRAAN